MNLKNIDIYLSRLVSALCLFLILTEANIWLDPLNNTLLVLGYRFFILLTPLLFFLVQHRVTFFAFVLVEAGLLLWIAQQMVLGTILFAIGISISGYMLKYYSSFSTRGAAGNKIALNVGSVLSGILVAITQSMVVTILFCIFAIFVSFLSFAKYYCREKISDFKTPSAHFNFNGFFTKKGIAWTLVGFAVGVKLIALVSILPQFLIINNDGHIPAWFGGMLILNSLIIVIFQMPIMKRITSFKTITAVLPLSLGMVLIMLSNTFAISTFFGAFIWTLSLSLIECKISLLDKLSQDDGLLLIKEAFVGLGSAATVFLVRFFDVHWGSSIVGAISFGLLLVSIFLFYEKTTKADIAQEAILA